MEGVWGNFERNNNSERNNNLEWCNLQKVTSTPSMRGVLMPLKEYKYLVLHKWYNNTIIEIKYIIYSLKD